MVQSEGLKNLESFGTFEGNLNPFMGPGSLRFVCLRLYTLPLNSVVILQP